MNPFLKADWTPKPLFQLDSPQQAPAPVAQPQSRGFLGSLVKSFTDPAAYLLNASIVNPLKETSAQLTGNKQALKNARAKSNENLGLGPQGDNFSGGLKKFAGNSAQALLTVGGGGLAANAAKSGTKSKVLADALLGAGFAGGGELAREGSSLDSVAQQALFGGVLGGAISGVASGAPKLLSKTAQKAGNKALEASDNLATRALKINDSKFATDFANRTGEEIGQFATRLNLVGKSAPQIKETIYRPALKVYSEGVKAIGTVPKSEVMATIRGELKPMFSSAFPEDKAFAKQVVKQADAILKKFKDEIPAAELNKLKSAAYGKVDTKLVDSAGKQANNAYDTLSNAFRKSINNAAERAGVQIDPAVLQQAGLNFKSTKIGDLGQELFGLEQLTKKLDVKSRVGKGKSLFGLSGSSGAVGGAVLGGPAGAVAGVAGSALVNSPGFAAKGSSLLESLGSKLAAGSPSAAGRGFSPGTAGIAGGALAESLLGARSGQSVGNNSAITPMTTNVMNMTNTSPISGEQYQGGGEMSSTPKSYYSLEAALMDVQRDPANSDYYMKLYQFANPEPKASKGRLNATQQQQSFNSQSALQDIGLIRDNLQRDPNVTLKNSLPGGGFTRRFTGTGNYEAARQNVADALGRLRSGGAINADEEKRFLNLLPGAYDDPNTAASKLQRLESLFLQFANPQSAGTSLEDALLSAQGAY